VQKKKTTFSSGQNAHLITGVFPTLLGFGIVWCERWCFASSVVCRSHCSFANAY